MPSRLPVAYVQMKSATSKAASKFGEPKRVALSDRPDDKADAKSSSGGAAAADLYDAFQPPDLRLLSATNFDYTSSSLGECWNAVNAASS